MDRSVGGTWRADGEGWELLWSPDEPHLSGTEKVLTSVRKWLAEEHWRGSVAVTPTGPFVPADVGEPLAVLSALFVLRWRGLGDFRLTGDAPRVPPVPPGAVG